MRKPSTIPRWGQWATGGAMLLVSLAAGTLGLVLNVSHGLEAGLAAGIAFGLADTAKIVIPIVAGVIGWSLQMRLTAVVCVAVSLWCAVNYYADHQGRDLISKQHGEAVYADKARTIAELETEARRIDALADAEAKKGGCGPNCRELMSKASEARQQLTAARSAREVSKPVEASGLAVMVAMASGGDAGHIARSEGAVTALLFLGLVETLVWLSVPAMRLLSQVAKPPVKAKARRKAKRKARKSDWTKIEAYSGPKGRKRKTGTPTNDNILETTT